MKLLIIGFCVRHIACSAARAGYSVAAADAFCDLDLSRCASETFLLNQDDAMQSLQALVENVSPDAIVLGPGLEEARVRGVAVLNNLPERAALVSDKLWLARWLERRGFPFIRTEASAGGIDFPAVIKPRKGAGGVGCRLVSSRADLRWEEGMIIQERIDGLPASVSVIGSGREARAVATNEQIIGAAFAGAKDFRYSGNITPLEPSRPELAEMAEEIISELRLVGTNGVDFLLTEKGPMVVEVNPRFQGSLDTVERSTGLNIFKAHLEAFQGILPERPIPVPNRTAGRVIFYAQEDLRIGAELFLEGLADCLTGCLTDIPRPGSLIKEGDPVVSILATGMNRADVLKLLIKRAVGLHRALEAK
jgi:predicted ATP-grasp superfamily ATP-dependent carboligase